MAFSEFRPLDDKSLVDYIKATPSLSSKLKNHLDDLKIKEVGDGNLNFVFIVVGSHGSLVFKQVELCRLTEQVVFSDPYKVSEYNRWTSPYLDSDAEAVLEDNALKLEVAELKSLLCERAQALIHGDLCTGSVMVIHDSTQVKDPEFAFLDQ